MTGKRFWAEPYRTRLRTRIAGVDADRVRVAETIFFAFSGGQESDRGTIGGRPVIEARAEGGDIVYTLDPGHGLRPGEEVEIAIDRPRRYRLMRLHFAAELVLELFCQRFPQARKAGAHIAEDKARIDFEWPESIAPLLAEIGAAARAIVEADREILSGFSDRAAGRRNWEVEGFARVPCGGTHLRRTGEVGAIGLKRRNPGRGLERIEIRLAEPAP